MCVALQVQGVKVKCLHIALADVFILNFRENNASPSKCQFPIQNVAIIHAVDMSQPYPSDKSFLVWHMWSKIHFHKVVW